MDVRPEQVVPGNRKAGGHAPRVEEDLTYREYAALVTYWWGVHQAVAEADETERRRRRDERLPVRIREEDWYVHTYRVYNGATGRWERYTERRVWR